MSTQPEWVYVEEDHAWYSQEEFQARLNPPTQIISPVESTSEQMRAVAPWRVARSLDVLLGQLNAMAPKRSKASDGSVGDAAHQANASSDHNPHYGPGIVTARDYTHDPANGLDCQKLANALVAAKDPRLKYVIWNRRIVDSRPGNNPWAWVNYSGTNPHTKHLHLSVMAAPICDDTRPWALPGMTGPAPAPQKAPMDRNQELDAMLTGVFHQMSGSPNVGEWPGWPSWPDGSGHKLTLVDYIRNQDVMMHHLINTVDALRAEVAELKQQLSDG